MTVYWKELPLVSPQYRNPLPLYHEPLIMIFVLNLRNSCHKDHIICSTTVAKVITNPDRETLRITLFGPKS